MSAHLRCSLTHQIFCEPVMLVTGQTYEREAIDTWFKTCARMRVPCTCPMTNKVLTNKSFTTNFLVKSIVAHYLEKHGSEEKMYEPSKPYTPLPTVKQTARSTPTSSGGHVSQLQYDNLLRRKVQLDHHVRFLEDRIFELRRSNDEYCAKLSQLRAELRTPRGRRY
jgi:hypothetical protein